MNTKTVSRACPVCEFEHAEVLHTQRFVLSENHPLKDGYDVVYCDRCGFCYADTAATQRDYDEFYSRLSKYADSATSTGGGTQPWDAVRLQEMAAEISRFEPDRDARIVDVGCANGGLLRELSRLGYRNLCGIDPSPGCATQTRLIPGVEAYAGFLSNMPEEAGPYDGVALSHVLEHVRDLVPVLRQMHASMNPGAWLYVETPDASRYQDFVPAPFQDFNTEHINHFSLPGLANLLRVAGFEPATQGSKTIFSALNMPYPAVFIIARRVSEPLPVEKDGALKDSLLKYISISRQLLETMDARIRAFCQDRKGIIVWGTGQLAMKLLADTSLARFKIEAFVDGNPTNQNKLLLGVPVVAPAALTDRATPILVASTINQKSIVAAIHKLGLPNPILTLSKS